MTWIHQKTDWPKFHWNKEALFQPLANLRGQHGRLLGKMETLGFALREEASLNALTNDVIKSSAIEGERLDKLTNALRRNFRSEATIKHIEQLISPIPL